jgi:hypothetical protein
MRAITLALLFVPGVALGLGAANSSQTEVSFESPIVVAPHTANPVRGNYPGCAGKVSPNELKQAIDLAAQAGQASDDPRIQAAATAVYLVNQVIPYQRHQNFGNCVMTCAVLPKAAAQTLHGFTAYERDVGSSEWGALNGDPQGNWVAWVNSNGDLIDPARNVDMTYEGDKVAYCATLVNWSHTTDKEGYLKLDTYMPTN